MDITKITIDYLTNRKKKYSIEKNEAFSLTDFEFYKPRLFKLTNQLLNSETPPELLEDITKTYTTYIKSCIEYFKAVDTCYLIQQEHIDHENIDTENNVPISNPSEDDMNELYPRNIKPVHYDISKFVTKVKNKSSNINTLPRTKEVILESGFGIKAQNL